MLPDLLLPSLPVWLAMHRDVRTSVRIRRVADFLYEELKRYDRRVQRVREIGAVERARP